MNQTLKTSMKIDTSTTMEIASSGPYVTLSILNRTGDGPTANLSDQNLADLIEVMTTIRKSRDRSSK